LIFRINPALFFIGSAASGFRSTRVNPPLHFSFAFCNLKLFLLNFSLPLDFQRIMTTILL